MRNKKLIKGLGIIGIVGVFVFSVFGCGGGGSSSSSGSSTRIALVWPDRESQSINRSTAQSSIPSDVTSILIQVSASDMATIETTIYPSVGQVTLAVPDGNNRKFQVWAYPENSPPNYYGTTTIDIFGNVNVIIPMSSSVPSDAVPTNAGLIIITDNFDVPANTATLWDNFGGSWNHPILVNSDLGYHGVADSGSSGTAAFVANQQYFEMADLSIETLLRIDGAEDAGRDVAVGFLFISDPIATGYYDEYSIILDIEYNGNPNPVARRLEVWYNNVTPGGETNTLMGAVDASIAFNTFYNLKLSMDLQGYIDVYLNDTSSSANQLASLSNVTPTPFASGMVGIGASYEGTFNDFSLTGPPIP